MAFLAAGDTGAGASSSGGMAMGGTETRATGGNEAGGSNTGAAIAGATGGTDSGGSVSGGTDSGGTDSGGTPSGGALTSGETAGDGAAGASGGTCGDSVVDAGEACDDGNRDWGDGRTPFCSYEPVCDASGCSSSCGDGLVLGGEQCDDGNGHDGDGCSADCTEEPGYRCAQPPLGERMSVPVVYRDLLASHPDFERGITGCEEQSPGMVALELDAEGKPVLGAGAATKVGCNFVTSSSTFRQWYRDVATVNATFVSTLPLYANGSGGYVNRYGSNGEPFLALSRADEMWCGKVGQENWDADGNRIPCTYCPSDPDTNTPECDSPREYRLPE